MASYGTLNRVYASLIKEDTACPSQGSTYACKEAKALSSLRPLNFPSLIPEQLVTLSTGFVTLSLEFVTSPREFVTRPHIPLSS